MTKESLPEVDDDPAIVERYQKGREMLLAGDVAGAMAILKELAAEGLAPAQHTLGDMYLHAAGGGEPDPAAALACYLAAAASDYPPAFSSLGIMYYHGIGVEKSVRKAAEYYCEGVKRSDLNSTVSSAELCASGELGEPNHDLAIAGFWDAAQRGSALAQRRLGAYYSEGKWVEQDLKLAAELYEAAATQGDEYAAYHLAAAYNAGNDGLPRDLGEAIRWYQVAAEKGLTVAQHDLGCLYGHPDSPHMDLQLAAMWFHKAAEGGARLSMESLARMYAEGEGVDVDLGKAAYWSDRAAATIDLDPVTGRTADPSALSSALTYEEGRQLKDMADRIRAIFRELTERPQLQAILIGDLLAVFLADCKDEDRETALKYVLEVAGEMIPVNQKWREEARGQQRH